MSTGLKANSDGSAAIQVGGSDAITLTSGGAAAFLTSPTTVQAGTVSAPSITFSGDTNTGIYSPGADTVAIGTGGTERLRVTSGGDVQIDSTRSGRLAIGGNASGAYIGQIIENRNSGGYVQYNFSVGSAGANGQAAISYAPGIFMNFGVSANDTTTPLVFSNNNGTERARITSDGSFLIAMQTLGITNAGFYVNTSTLANIHAAVANTRTDASGACFYLNRQGSDGTLIEFRQANTAEGTISVSGTTVSYNGGHLSRYAQTQASKDESLLKGTVLSNLDDMNEYFDEDGNPVSNEQLNKVKVSDAEGDVNVAGVFVNWSYDETHQVDEINMAMTGDMIIRIAQGVTVQKGDLLMSAGDGTAKPQGDDIVRSKTVAKVTSNHVTCTYEDGSYCVPCVLMAC